MRIPEDATAPMPHTLPSTASLLRSLAASLPGRLPKSDDWTRDALQAVAGLLGAFGPTTVHAARRTKGDKWCSEYLVDLAITSDSSDPTAANDPFGYHRLLLAAECEWSPSLFDLKYDFCKLADSRASIRLFVGYTRSSEAAATFASAAQKFLDAHELVTPTDEYGVLLLVGGILAPHAWVLTRLTSTAPVDLSAVL